jgi:hypothetical protein
MGFKPANAPLPRRHAEQKSARAEALLQEVALEKQRFARHLPTTRHLLEQVANQPFATR